MTDKEKFEDRKSWPSVRLVWNALIDIYNSDASYRRLSVRDVMDLVDCDEKSARQYIALARQYCEKFHCRKLSNLHSRKGLNVGGYRITGSGSLGTPSSEALRESYKEWDRVVSSFKRFKKTINQMIKPESLESYEVDLFELFKERVSQLDEIINPSFFIIKKTNQTESSSQPPAPTQPPEHDDPIMRAWESRC